MPPLPRNNARSGKAAKRAMDNAARAPKDDNRRTVITDTKHIGYDSGSEYDVRHLTPRARQQMGFPAYPKF